MKNMKTLSKLIISAVLFLGLQSQTLATDEQEEMGLTQRAGHIESENNTKIIISRKRKRHELVEDHIEEDTFAKRINQEQTPLTSQTFIEELPDEIMLFIFSLLKQSDIPSATRICARWKRLMEDDQLWKDYAKKAFIIMSDKDT